MPYNPHRGPRCRDTASAQSVCCTHAPPVGEGAGGEGAGGEGAGGEGVAPSSPTYRSALVSPALKPLIAFLSALASNSATTPEGFMLGFASSTSAAPPAT